MKIHAHGTGLLLAALLLPATASALECERNGTCADSRLNQTYEIKQEIRRQGDETRRVIRETRRPVESPPVVPEHRARKELLESLKPKEKRL